jgi:ribosomal protein S27E
MFTGVPNPDGARKPCPDCGQPTTVFDTAGGRVRLHCGTFTARCHTTRARRTK